MWIAAEFQKAGVKPGYVDSYLQPVPLVEFRTARTSSLTISRSGKKLKFQAPAARVSFPIDGTRTGELVFAGFGITAPELHYDDYANINAKGKIVVVFDHRVPAATQASATSRRLWLGISVAMPTAMPLAPLSNANGNRAGNCLGSSVEPS